MNTPFIKRCLFKQVQTYSMIQFDLRAPENFKIRNFQASLRHTIFFIGLIRSISIHLHSPALKLAYLRLFQQALFRIRKRKISAESFIMVLCIRAESFVSFQILWEGVLFQYE
ncbi:hypothetical protein B879_00829 [Cecembia lonarensis LW9]|uniref:Uncharacterized protein n=1 Tax=Cecembia lonarensis (strain CCUG 58316 / KCTC 22772 / LW9) TaxID=1225176 RepID=K1L7B4_CECL9|nr:hypothetical protein B879_00829 [Cecembia lonarensis LW9]